MAKRLYEVLYPCKKEEEVKEQFVKFFKIKLNALGRIDHYSEEILYEFKLDKNFRNRKNMAAVIAQTMYYARLLKYGTIPNPLPPIICIVDKNEAFFLETKNFKRFYTSESYDWDRCASSPDPSLISAIESSNKLENIHVFDLDNEQEEKLFIESRKRYSCRQLSLFENLDKKDINETNFLDVYKLWFKLFGNYVKNGHKPSEYFLSDIEQNKSFVLGNQIGFNLGDGNARLKNLPQKEYEYFWSIYNKIESKDVSAIRQKSDRISEDYERRFTGEFYTPVEFARKGLQYLEKTLGKEWWKTGEYRMWDMAAGTGNLEFMLPESALPYCYISTLLEDDAKYCKKIFPQATCFQYDYLNDDIGFLINPLNLGFSHKMPENLVKDLENPQLKWIIFINPPWATSNNAGNIVGKKSKDDVSKTKIRELMTRENLGETSRELFSQFLYRISKEFKGKNAYLGLYSTLKYLNAKNDKKARDSFFQYVFKKGFIFSIKHFGVKKNNQDFPVGFLIWDLGKNKRIEDQNITLDVFNKNFEKYGTKKIFNTENNTPITKWFQRERNTRVMPPFSSAISIADGNKDIRDRVTDNFICSIANQGNDFQHQNLWCILSGPGASAGAFSVTPCNFEKSMILHAVKKIPSKEWTNNRDQFFVPNSILPNEFINDCIIWSAFADSNNTVALSDIHYKRTTYQIPNNLYPYALKELRSWSVSLSDMTLQISTANEDRFLAQWLSNKDLSKEALDVYETAKKLYKYFYEHLINTHWAQFKISRWDVGLWQIKQALKDANLGTDLLKSLKEKHKFLGNKLLPLIYKYGFVFQDVVLFEDEN